MSASCSSQNNGCEACGIGLSFWTIEASASAPIEGFGCLNGDPLDEYEVYQNATSRGRTFSRESNQSSDYWNHHSYTAIANSSLSSSQTVEYIISPYGNLFVGFNSTSSSMSKAQGSGGGSVTPFEGGDIVYCGLYELGADSINSFTSVPKIECNSDTGVEYLTYITDGFSRLNSKGCGGWCFRGQCWPDCDTACKSPGLSSKSEGPGSFVSVQAEADSCETASSELETDNGEAIAALLANCPPSCGNLDYTDGERPTYISSNSLSSINLSSLTSKDFFYGKAKSACDAKLSIFESNKAQNCRGDLCGEGEEYDCWSLLSFYSLSFPEKPNAKTVKIKIGTLKEPFEKEYSSIAGKVKVYYGGQGSPCCDNDFDGTIVKELSYSLDSSSTFKDGYIAVDVGRIDNDGEAEGRSLGICYTVDTVEFIAE